MRHLFSPEGEAALAATLAQRPLLAFDFDGTLAPIVSRPDEARVSRVVERRLARLSQVLPLAIVSGRSIDDVRRRLAFEPGFIVGSHGAEDAMLPSGSFATAFDPLRERLQRRAGDLDAVGVTVEDKRDSIALHYRRAADPSLALARISDVLGGLEPELAVSGGKMVFNVVALSAPDKAQAIATLVQRCDARAALFVGDDVNDEPVFRRPEPNWLTIRVGRDDPQSAAQFFLDRPREVATLLDRMLVLLGVARGRRR